MKGLAGVLVFKGLRMNDTAAVCSHWNIILTGGGSGQGALPPAGVVYPRLLVWLPTSSSIWTTRSVSLSRKNTLLLQSYTFTGHGIQPAYDYRMEDAASARYKTLAERERMTGKMYGQAENATKYAGT